MKHLLIILTLLLAGCETEAPYHLSRVAEKPYDPCMNGATVCNWNGEVVGGIYETKLSWQNAEGRGDFIAQKSELEKRVDKLEAKLNEGKLPNGCPFNNPECWEAEDVWKSFCLSTYQEQSKLLILTCPDKIIVKHAATKEECTFKLEEAE